MLMGEIFCLLLKTLTEISFASYPASMIAAGSIMAAACGLLQREWCDAFHLVTKLQNIVSAEAVIHRFICFPRKMSENVLVMFAI
jgi:Cyclin, C-terminal domain